jgi:hypothetical protein
MASPLKTNAWFPHQSQVVLGEGTRRQLQAVVQRHELDLLSRAAAVGGARQGERAEDGHVAAGVEFRQALAGLAVGQGEGAAQVAGALQGEEVPQGGAARLEQALPDATLDVVDRRPLGSGRADEGEQRAGEVVERRGVVATGVVCEHGSGPPGQGEHGVVTLHVVFREALVVQSRTPQPLAQSWVVQERAPGYTHFLLRLVSSNIAFPHLPDRY